MEIDKINKLYEELNSKVLDFAIKNFCYFKCDDFFTDNEDLSIEFIDTISSVYIWLEDCHNTASASFIK